jgi:anti-sigma-K factor RskA
MIPEDRDALNVLAGEYVLGLLDPAEAREIEAARASNAALRSAIDFWQQRLHPLAALAPPAEPPSDLWSGIAARLDSVPQTGAARWWNRTSPWRWATAGMAALAVALLLYIALSPPSPSYIAMLYAPQEKQASWIATVGHDGLTIRTVAAINPPPGRAFELWAIAPGATPPQALGVIPPDGVLRLGALPSDVRPGTRLAITVEPPGGSPTERATGPVVFVGDVTKM